MSADLVRVKVYAELARLLKGRRFEHLYDSGEWAKALARPCTACTFGELLDLVGPEDGYPPNSPPLTGPPNPAP